MLTLNKYDETVSLRWGPVFQFRTERVSKEVEHSYVIGSYSMLLKPLASRALRPSQPPRPYAQGQLPQYGSAVGPFS